jgi:hypothetical protein
MLTPQPTPQTLQCAYETLAKLGGGSETLFALSHLLEAEQKARLSAACTPGIPETERTYECGAAAGINAILLNLAHYLAAQKEKGKQ